MEKKLGEKLAIQGVLLVGGASDEENPYHRQHKNEERLWLINSLCSKSMNHLGLSVVSQSEYGNIICAHMGTNPESWHGTRGYESAIDQH